MTQIRFRRPPGPPRVWSQLPRSAGSTPHTVRSA